ncbi:MAG: hypothetical protein WKF75_00510 [Singulisphaera sp.]
MNLSLSVTFIVVAALGQAPPNGPDRLDDPASRLDFMKKSLATYDVHSTDERGPRYHLQAEPILRFTNPVGGSQDGAIFLWLDESDRPGVVVQVFRKQEGPWSQEFLSLSTSPLISEARSGPAWTPSRGGIELRPVPEAPKPAATAEQRLLQMRALARQFSAEDYFKDKSWNTLRLLSRPLARYGKPGSDLVDGALLLLRPDDRPGGLPDPRGANRHGRARMAVCVRPHDDLRRQGLVEGPGGLESPRSIRGRQGRE